jgi:predicted dehydrogenase
MSDKAQAKARIGIVGNNLYGQVFARAVAAAGRAHAVAICPELGESPEPLATEQQLKPYPTLQAMLEGESLDAVLLASVTAHHEADTLAALAAGVHVLMDRPVALSLEACDRMAARARSTRRVVMVGHVLQFWPEYVAVRERVQRGELGDITAVTASRVSGLLNPDWRARLLNPAYGFGGLEAHVHDIDLLNTLLGEPETVWAQGSQTPAGGWQRVQTSLGYPNGCKAAAEADYSVPLNFPLMMYLRVVGQEGTLVYTFRGALSASETARRRLMLYKPDAAPAPVEVTVTDAYVGMINHFLDGVQRGTPLKWGTLQQAKSALRVLLTIEQAARAK